MKKILLLSLSIIIVSITQAGYVIKIPLEQNQGGPLPTGSIRLSEIKSPTSPDIDTSWDCPTWNSRQNDWLSLPQYNQDIIYYEGTTMFLPTRADLYSNEGFIYKKGSLKQIEGEVTEHYAICRKAI